MSGLPSTWCKCEGKDVFEIVRGVSYDKSTVRSTPQAGFIPVLRATNIQSGRIIASDLVFVPGRFVSEKQRLQPGDLLIATSSGSKDIVGKGAQADQSHTSFAFGAFCSVARPRNNILGDWLGYFAQSADYRTFVEQVALGININNFRTSDLARLPLSVPPLPEQRRIVAKLDSLTGSTGRAQEQLGRIPRLINKYREAILAAAFSGDLTQEWCAENAPRPWTIEQKAAIKTRREGYLSGRRGSRLKDAPPLEFDADGRGWISCCLADVADLRVGYAFKSSWFSQEGPRLLRGANIAPGRLIWNDEKRLAASRVDDFQEYQLRAGDIVIAMDRPLISSGLKIAMVGPEDDGAFLVQRVATPACSNFIQNRYLWWLLNSPIFIDQINRHSTGSDLPHISGNDILTTPVPLAPVPEQAEIVRRIETAFMWLDRVAAEHANASRLLPKLDQAVLAKAFRGELVTHD
jgi:type I restriction enzyme, S subunit